MLNNDDVFLIFPFVFFCDAINFSTTINFLAFFFYICKKFFTFIIDVYDEKLLMHFYLSLGLFLIVLFIFLFSRFRVAICMNFYLFITGLCEVVCSQSKFLLCSCLKEMFGTVNYVFLEFVTFYQHQLWRRSENMSKVWLLLLLLLT